MLNHRACFVTRDVEWGNILLGFEQANRYALRDERGGLIGYIAEEGDGLGSAIKRQLLRVHRPFTATVLGLDGRVLFRVRRPFYWINSSMFIEDPQARAVVTRPSFRTPKPSPQGRRPAPGQSPGSPGPIQSETEPPCNLFPPLPHVQGNVLGEVHQRWHLLQRNYDVYIGKQQFAEIKGEAFGQYLLRSLSISLSRSR